MSKKIPETYLGDGVYASHDGYHVWLAVNHHENKVVALEPEVLKALVMYARRAQMEMRPGHVQSEDAESKNES